jgi:hypothetical protein
VLRGKNRGDDVNRRRFACGVLDDPGWRRKEIAHGVLDSIGLAQQVRRRVDAAHGHARPPRAERWHFSSLRRMLR